MWCGGRTCPLVQEFWQKVCNLISDIHGVSFPTDPEVCLLGNYTNSDITQDYAIRLTEILLIIAKKCIAIKWKSDTVIPISLWLSEVNNCVPLEKLTYWLRNKSEVFHKIWQPLFRYMEDTSIDQMDSLFE